MSITATITGRVTQEPDLKFGQSGKAVTSLNVAVNHRRKNQSGEWEDSGTTWVRVTLFGAHAENAVEQAPKGALIVASGRLETREYEKRDGQKGASLEMLADEIGVTIPRWAPKGQQQPAPAQGFGQQNTGQPDPWGGSGAGWGDNSQPAF